MQEYSSEFPTQPRHEANDSESVVARKAADAPTHARPRECESESMVARKALEAPTEPPTTRVVDPGTVLRYVPNRLLARGGCGEVWDAVQESLGRVIAIKRLRQEFFEQQVVSSMDAETVRRGFMHEALLTAFLEHPNIVPIYDIGKDIEGRPVLIMRLIKGRPWETLIQGDAEAPLPEVLDRHIPILVQMAQAVAFAHSRGVLHLDLKPSQVMVGEFGEVLLMDWGLAAVYDREKFDPPNPRDSIWDLIPRVESIDRAAGTPAYMAPEQTGAGLYPLGPWTDVFLLGATLYMILTGKPPHEPVDSSNRLKRAIQCRITPPREAAPQREIPPDLADLCMRALERDPKDRIPAVSQFIQELRDLTTGARQRRESRTLAERVEGHLAEATDSDYRILTECEVLLDRAKGLWFDNPAIHPLRMRLLSRYARAAMDNNDLVLARRLILRMDESEEQQELNAELSALETLGTMEKAELETLERERRSTEIDLRSVRGELAGARSVALQAVEAAIAFAELALRHGGAALDGQGGARITEVLEGVLPAEAAQHPELMARGRRLAEQWAAAAAAPATR